MSQPNSNAPLPYEALIVDVDGTLVDDTFIVTPAVRESLTGLVARGIPVLLSTGKPKASCARYIDEMNLRGYHTFCAGAHITDPLGAGDLYRSRLSAANVAAVATACRQADLTVEAYTPDGFYISEDNDYVAVEERFILIRPEVERDLATLAQKQDVIKLQVVLGNDREKMEGIRIMEQFADRFDYSLGHVSGTRHIDFYSFLEPGVSKGTALERTAKASGIPAHRFVAVGDAVGDISLLQGAGIGVAMADAPEEVRQAADATVPPVTENGLCQVIARYFPA